MTDKTLSPKQLEKRTRILDAAIHLFAQNGFAATTIADIAKEAGVSFGTVFTYFENKEALFEAGIREPLDRLNTVFSRREITDEPILKQLESMVTDQLLFMTKERNYLQLIQQVLGQPAKFPDLMDELDNTMVIMKDTLIPIIEKGQAEGELDKDDPELTAESYVGFLIGIRLTFTDHALSDGWKSFIPKALKLFGPIRYGDRGDKDVNQTASS